MNRINKNKKFSYFLFRQGRFFKADGVYKVKYMSKAFKKITKYKQKRANLGVKKMSIPASYIVDITPRIISAGASGVVINGLFLTKNNQLPVNTVKEFISSDMVGEYFGYDSAEYNVSVIYFAGYENSFAKPKSLKFARRISSDTSAFLRGAKFNGTLEALKLITDGAFNLSIDGSSLDLSSINLSEATSLSEVALKVQSAINTAGVATATVTYSALNGAFQINSGKTGTASTITYATAPSGGSDLSTVLGLTLQAGAIISQGLQAQSPTENMQAITNIDSNFVTFSYLYDDLDSQEGIEFAQWSNSKGVNYCFIIYSNEATALNPDVDTDLASIISNSGATNFVASYNNVEIAAGIMGVFASVDYERPNSAIDLAFKKVQGLTPTVTNIADAMALDGKKYSYMGQFATKNIDFNFIYKGLIYGDYVNISTYINAIWLNESIKNVLLTNIQTVGKLSYNEQSYAIIRVWIGSVLDQAVNNGVIQTGITLSASQIAQITSEVGEDVSSQLFSNGYFLQILAPSSSVRAVGDSPIINLYYTDGGVIKKLSISSTVIM